MLVVAADDAYELRSFTPSFLWLLRDFYLDLEEDGHKVGAGSRRTQSLHLATNGLLLTKLCCMSVIAAPAVAGWLTSSGMV